MIEDRAVVTEDRDGAAALAAFFEARRGRMDDADHIALWESLRQATEGGKRVRPLLFSSVHTALGGTFTEAAAQIAAALELLHTALIVHDDVIDGDDLRRGRPNVAGAFVASARAEGAAPERARVYGDAAAILAGDLALAGVVRLVALCGAPTPVVRRLLDLLDDALHVTAAGELADVRLSVQRAASTQETLLMSGGKTAAYSFQLPLQMAAVLAGSDEETLDRLGRFGWLLGTAFQLRDDLHGMFDETTRTGKPALSDLREGKDTVLITIARTTSEWEQIAPYVGRPVLTEDETALVRGLLERCGARAAVERIACELAEQAADAVAGLPAEPLLQTWLAAVTRDLRSAA